MSSHSAPAVHGPVEPLDRLPARDGIDEVARGEVRAHDVGRLRAELGHEAADERRPERVDDVVGDDRRDELTPQRVLAEEVAEALDDRVREVAAQRALGEGLVGSSGRSSAPVSERLA